jgi:hypothetical protein
VSHGKQAAAHRRGDGFSAGLDPQPGEERLQRDVDLMLVGTESARDVSQSNALGERFQQRAQTG